MTFEDHSVLDTSVHYVGHPSAFARRHLLFCESMGRFDVTAQYRTSRLSFNSYLLMIVTDGTIMCGTNGSTATASAGEALLINCHHPHTYYALTASSFYFVHLSGTPANDLADCILDPGRLPVHGKNTDMALDLLRDLLDKLTTGKVTDEAQISAALYQLLAFLISDVRANHMGLGSTQLVDKAVETILTHLNEHLTLNALAAQSGCSVSYFSREFKRSTGFAPYAFILRARLDHAKHLLMTTDLSIQEIADRTGFASLANFSYTFRKNIGISPTDFRKHPV